MQDHSLAALLQLLCVLSYVLKSTAKSVYWLAQCSWRVVHLWNVLPLLCPGTDIFTECMQTISPDSDSSCFAISVWWALWCIDGALFREATTNAATSHVRHE